MRLTDEQSAAVRYCVADTIRRRRLSGVPIPRWLLELNAATSSWGPEPEGAQPNSDQQQIGSAQAAKIIGCSRRHISRIASDLDGRLVAGRWVFGTTLVTEYAQQREARNG